MEGGDSCGIGGYVVLLEVKDAVIWLQIEIIQIQVFPY